MKKIRIGNDIPISWTICRNGEAENFDGKTLKLLMRSMSEEVEITDYTIDENVLKWTFFGKDQTKATTYTFTLIENEGEEGMFTIDACSALQLVDCSCDADDDDSDMEIEEDGNISDSETEVSSSINIGGSDSGSESSNGLITDTEFEDLKTDSKTILGAINELYDKYQTLIL